MSDNENQAVATTRCLYILGAGKCSLKICNWGQRSDDGSCRCKGNLANGRPEPKKALVQTYASTVLPRSTIIEHGSHLARGAAKTAPSTEES